MFRDKCISRKVYIARGEREREGYMQCVHIIYARLEYRNRDMSAWKEIWGKYGHMTGQSLRTLKSINNTWRKYLT